jgi:hypothetical protein
MADQSDNPPAVDPRESSAEEAQQGDSFAAHPELFVGAAFVGGFALAKVLGRMAQ